LQIYNFLSIDSNFCSGNDDDAKLGKSRQM